MTRRPLILGLTGSIGMGKSATAAVLRGFGIPVQDADAVVHRLLRADRATIGAIEAAFPGVVTAGQVSRPKLGAAVFGNPSALRRLEAIIHPRVTAERLIFLKRHARHWLVVLDIPLLFETGIDKSCDRVMVVTAPAQVQAARVLRRPGMTVERLAAIRAQQWPDLAKRRQADYIIPTGLGRAVTRLWVLRALRQMRAAPPPVGSLLRSPPAGRRAYARNLSRYRNYWL
jgi:dephospho-CoA kinase